MTKQEMLINLIKELNIKANPASVYSHLPTTTKYKLVKDLYSEDMTTNDLINSLTSYIKNKDNKKALLNKMESYSPLESERTRRELNEEATDFLKESGYDKFGNELEPKPAYLDKKVEDWDYYDEEEYKATLNKDEDKNIIPLDEEDSRPLYRGRIDYGDARSRMQDYIKTKYITELTNEYFRNKGNAAKQDELYKEIIANIRSNERNYPSRESEIYNRTKRYKDFYYSIPKNDKQATAMLLEHRKKYPHYRYGYNMTRTNIDLPHYSEQAEWDLYSMPERSRRKTISDISEEELNNIRQKRNIAEQDFLYNKFIEELEKSKQSNRIEPKNTPSDYKHNELLRILEEAFNPSDDRL